jgi:predicted N-acyltransferase
VRSIKPHTSITSISESLWRRAAETASPFHKYEFFHALEASQSIGKHSGWQPLYFVDEEEETIMYAFVKNNSYGEYIFDWQWANAYRENSIPYYPKLTSMIPFTPVTTPHFISKEPNLNSNHLLMNSYEELYSQNDLSSSHFLFIEAREHSFFQEYNYLIRDSVQYHFANDDYNNFEHFLTNLKGRKAKQIRKERILQDVLVQSYTGDQLTKEHAERMYQFYCHTIEDKNAIDYLKKDFFLIIFETMKQNILYVEATQNGEAVAGSLFFYDSTKLYGRYWGSSKTIFNLHFELCYYQGIDFCIENKLKTFEAGAQGEHKIPRGFRPVKTFSAHKLKNSMFQNGIGNYILEEKKQLDLLMTELSKQLPFK